MGSYVLLFRTKDRHGVVEDISKLVTDSLNGNFRQFIGEQWEGCYAIRAEFDLPTSSSDSIASLRSKFNDHIPGEDKWLDIIDPDKKKRMAVLVSKEMHCLNHLLNYWESQDLGVEITSIISNHDGESRKIADRHSIPFHKLEVVGRKQQAETELAGMTIDTDFLVLARYMQILSGDFISSYARPIINVHHGDVAAFPGAKPYHQAHARGVKSLHPTAHYVTAQVDAGPIIEQVEIRVRDTDSVTDYIRKGKLGESDALLRAVQLHANSRVIVYNNKTLRFQS